MNTSSLLLRTLVFACILLGLASTSARANDDQYLSIVPLKTYLSASTRTSFITVKNKTAERKVFLLYAESWTQDEKGVDSYADASELIFFPRRLELEPGAETVVRVGVRAVASSTERAYRLYLEESKTFEAAENKGAVVNFLMRFALPVFVNPVSARDGLKVGDLQSAGGRLLIDINNTGNRHQEIPRLDFVRGGSSATPTFTVPTANKYLHSGTSRRYEVEIPKDQCASGAEFTLVVPGSRSQVSQAVRLSPDSCR